MTKSRKSRTPESNIRKIRVRQALERDRKEAVAILRSEGLEARFEQKEFWIVEHRGKPVGCARLKFLGDCYELASVAVRKSYQNRGVGTLLTRACLDAADDRVFCLTRVMSFFKRFGFLEISVRSLPSELRRKHEQTCFSDADAMMVEAGNPMAKNLRVLFEKVKHDISVTKKAMEKLKIAVPPRSHYRKVAEDFLSMAKSYHSDAIHFLEKGNAVLALAAVNYAHGWLDAGARLGLFDVGGDDTLFTLAE